ncbi:hypothetical protein [Dictyobacter formicarum]|uniref:hypothetical protein n=1 Tax=Dictyobacter formicarum TaxID=2778368 RepID=UPI0019158A51|nr:hypothetical protein [Dictyobacter formicarum]
MTAVECIIAFWRSTRQPLEACDQRYNRRQTASMDNRYVPTTVTTSEVQLSDVRPVPIRLPPFTGGVQQDS